MISVLRMGHRLDRDKRITTHVGLVARAFGADEILIDTKDDRILKTIKSVCDRFGGSIKVKTGINSVKIAKQWTGVIVHLTMYGESIDKIVNKIDKSKDLLIIVGAEKVPAFFYDISTYNISVGNQPHSEVSALAIFLDRYTNGSWLNKEFNGKIKINPSLNGKDVETYEK
jgi:tRNA (cytidine56-2'-O)-methyltransferase